MLYGHNTCNELIWFINLNSNLQAKLYFVLHPCWQLISSPCLHLEFDSQTVSWLSFLKKLFTLAHLAAHSAAFFFFLHAIIHPAAYFHHPPTSTTDFVYNCARWCCQLESKRSTRLHPALCTLRVGCERRQQRDNMHGIFQPVPWWNTDPCGPKKSDRPTKNFACAPDLASPNLA